MSTFRLFAPALLLALTVTSCSSNSSTETPDTRALPEADFCDAYAARICSLYSPCCAQIDHPIDDEECRTMAKAECGAIANYARSESLAYDGIVARDCITQIDRGVTANCLVSDPESQEEAEAICKRDVYRGSTPLGGACQRDDDCARHPEGRTACDTHTLGATFTCVLPTDSDVGGPCLQRDDDHRLFLCRQGYTCNASKQCVPPLGKDETCAFGSQRADCASPHLCMNGVCSERPEIGEACQLVTSEVCGSEAFCSLESGVCEALLAEGASCTDSEQCESRRCQGTCQPRVELGEACDPKEGMRACSEGFCEETQLVCKALLREHDTCTFSTQCESGRCDGGVCVHPSYIATKICGAVSGGEMPTPAP